MEGIEEEENKVGEVKKGRKEGGKRKRERGREKKENGP